MKGSFGLVTHICLTFFLRPATLFLLVPASLPIWLQGGGQGRRKLAPRGDKREQGLESGENLRRKCALLGGGLGAPRDSSRNSSGTYRAENDLFLSHYDLFGQLGE